jgi:hypothetical protein
LIQQLVSHFQAERGNGAEFIAASGGKVFSHRYIVPKCRKCRWIVVRDPHIPFGYKAKIQEELQI